MKVLNVHERELRLSDTEIAALIDGLSSAGDRLWPHERWPAMRLDGPLAVGARGGHGPIRYSVESYEPGRRVVFRFEGPRGFDGTHCFEAVLAGPNRGARLRHVVEMRARGAAAVTWPLVFRPLHDALLEDALDKAQSRGGESALAHPSRWSPWVRVLRAALGRRARRRRPRSAASDRSR